MTTLLLMISFLLHLLALVAIHQLFKQIQTYKQAKTAENTEDITDLLETYLEEIKDENNRLQMELTKSRASSKPDKNNGTTSSLEKIEQTPIDSIYGEAPCFDTDDSIETSLQAKVLQLSHQGYDAEAIAEKLNCGKTEAALIIKLQEKNRRNA
ncbi:MAG TPA: hypothetical protein VK091_05295 [Virgibacillus sp.]|nr:hypothetical protein [Virgibacillus sp.]